MRPKLHARRGTIVIHGRTLRMHEIAAAGDLPIPAPHRPPAPLPPTFVDAIRKDAMGEPVFRRGRPATDRMELAVDPVTHCTRTVGPLYVPLKAGLVRANRRARRAGLATVLQAPVVTESA